MTVFGYTLCTWFRDHFVYPGFDFLLERDGDRSGVFCGPCCGRKRPGLLHSLDLAPIMSWRPGAAGAGVSECQKESIRLTIFGIATAPALRHPEKSKRRGLANGRRNEPR